MGSTFRFAVMCVNDSILQAYILPKAVPVRARAFENLGLNTFEAVQVTTMLVRFWIDNLGRYFADHLSI